VLAYMLDETEFLGPHGIRSLSRYHLEHPFVFHVSGEEYKFQYVLGESNTGMFGGNSNWPRMDAGQWTASTTTWAKTRFKTCSFSALPILFSSPSGIGSASKACRSRWRKLRCRGSRQFLRLHGRTPRRRAESSAASSDQHCDGASARAGCRDVAARKSQELKGIRPLGPLYVVRGQFRDYRDEPGVKPDSQTETFVALRLEINSWRWKGVPFYIRAGKSLPVTATEVIVKLRQPPAVFTEVPLPANYFRFRVTPDLMMRWARW